MKSFTPKLVVDNKNKDQIRDLSQFFYVKNSNITAENLEKLSEHFNTSIEKKVHPWSFEKNLDDQLKGADRVHFLYLYYLIYINAVHEDIFYGLLNDGCDGSYAELFRRDEENNSLALQVLKYNILSFKKIDCSKMKIKKVLHNLKNLINRLFGFKDKKINKQKLTLVVNKTDNQEGMSKNAYFSTIEEHFTFEEDISEEDRSELKNHLKESIENKVHPWDFEKNLDFKLKEPDQIYYLFMYCFTYIDIFEQDLFNKFTKLWYENNLDDTTKSDDEINNEALRLLKYEVLGFNLINGSKVEPIKELEEFAEYTFDEAMFNTKSDNLPLLLKAWKTYQEKVLLEDKEKLKLH